MTLPPTYRRRKAIAAGAASDVFEYGAFPPKLRVQIEHILVRAIGPWEYNDFAPRPQNAIWTGVVEAMRTEEGVHRLPGAGTRDNPQVELLAFMSTTDDIDAYLEALEWLMRYVDTYIREFDTSFDKISKKSPDRALEEINARILESSVGYEYRNGEVIRVDTLLIHSEVVIPAIELTNDRDFSSANAEYMKAHEAFRHADYEVCLTECAKAFESVLKVIAHSEGWDVQPSDPASKLIQAGVSAGFLKPYTEAGFNALQSLLKSGVPTLRNKASAHGAGAEKRVVPAELAAFQLHQTAAVIVFLIGTFRARS